MGKVWCAQGYACGESHGLSSSHWEDMSDDELSAIDQEIEEYDREAD